MKLVRIIFITALILGVIIVCGAPVQPVVKYLPGSLTVHADVNVNITSGANGTVYISISGIEVQKYARSQVVAGYHNSSHIYVSYTGLYVDSPEDDLVPVIVEIYNGTSQKVYAFNASSFTDMQKPYPNTVFKIAYYNVTNFTSIHIVVYDVTNPSSPKVVFTGDLPPPPQPGDIWNREYVSYLATLVPLALLIMLAGRGNILGVGLGLVVYGVVVLLLPYLRLYPPYIYTVSAMSITLGVVIIFFSQGGE